MKSISLLVLCSALAVFPAHAEDLDQVGQLQQAQFEALSHDMGAALSYKALLPAEPMGILGFDISLDASVTQLQNEQVWQAATGESMDALALARIRVAKGLPFGFDVGGFYATAPGSNIKTYGAELRYALVEGGVATPAIGIRAAATRLSGVDNLSFETRSLDISISKGFGPITPYAGVGQVWVDSEYDDQNFPGACPIVPTIACGGALASFNESKYFAGVRLTLIPFHLVLEADKTGDATTYSLKLGVGF